MTDTPEKSESAIKTEKVVEAFGGIRPMAKQLGVPVTTVQYWKKAGHIPQNRHAEILESAKSLNLPIDANDLIAPEAGKAEESAIDLPGTEADRMEPLSGDSSTNAPTEPLPVEPAPSPVQAETVQAETESQDTAPKAEQPATETMPSPPAPSQPASPSQPTTSQTPKRAGNSLALLALAVSVVALLAPTLRGPISSAIGPSAAQSLFGPDTASRVGTVEGRVATLEARVAEATNTLKTTSDSLGRLGDDVPGVLGRMDMVERGTKSLIDEVTALKQSLASVQLDQATNPIDLASRITALEEQMQQASTELSGLAALMREADPQGIAKLTTSIGNIQDLLGRLAGDLDTAKANITTLAGRADTLAGLLEARTQNNQSNEAMLLAAIRLETALRGNAPYGAALGLTRSLGSLDSQFGATLDILATHAESGVQTAPQLRESLRLAIPGILAAGAAEGASWTERTLDTLARLVSIRRAPGSVEGDTPDAVLARAEAALQALDLAGAVAEVEKLTDPHAQAAASWLAAAKARLAMDAAADQLVGLALTRLIDQRSN